MSEEKKQSIQLALSLLKSTLIEEKVLLGVLVDKEEPDKSKICFLDLDSYCFGKKDGFTVELEQFNKDVIESK